MYNGKPKAVAKAARQRRFAGAARTENEDTLWHNHRFYIIKYTTFDGAV
jgi:hypothetical protein